MAVWGRARINCVWWTPHCFTGRLEASPRPLSPHKSRNFPNSPAFLRLPEILDQITLPIPSSQHKWGRLFEVRFTVVRIVVVWGGAGRGWLGCRGRSRGCDFDRDRLRQGIGGSAGETARDDNEGRMGDHPMDRPHAHPLDVQVGKQLFEAFDLGEVGA